MVALKIINIDDIKEDYVRRNLNREEKIMRALHHPNIVQLYEVVQEGNLHCLSMELVRGVNLYQYITSQQNPSIPEKLARFFFYQMLSAVQYMHKLNVIHRDLKLENILVEYGHIIKIADFGLSNVYYPCLELRTHCGSIEYAAPELFKTTAYGTAADIWSLGVVLYVMVVGKMPFPFRQKKGDHVLNTRMRHLFVQRIMKGLIQDNWELMEKLSQDCWDLLHELLNPDQFSRIRIEATINHPWIIKDRYLMKRLPQKRKDLQRKFHPEVIEYLAYKLNTSKTRIETHLHVYQNDKIAAMYFMVRNVLVKEVLHPLKEFENSFLYQFECWRENLKLQHQTQKLAYGDEQNKKVLTEGKIQVSLRNVPTVVSNFKGLSESFSGHFSNNLKLQKIGETNAQVVTSPPLNYSVKKIRQCTSKDVDQNKDEQEQGYSIRFRSYRNSRPQSNSIFRNSHREIVENSKNANEMEETSSNSIWSKKIPNNSNKEEHAKDNRNFNQNILNNNSDSYRKVFTTPYREYSSRVLEGKRNKLKRTTYTSTKTLENTTGKETKNNYHSKIHAKVCYSANEIPGIKEANSITKNIEILKRTDTNMDMRKLIPNMENENSFVMQTPRRQPTYNSRKNGEILVNKIPKDICAQTPSRIPVKIINYGPPASFSQSPIPFIRNASNPTRSNGTKLCRGDPREYVR